MAKKNTFLIIPPVIEGIDRIKRKLAGTDRDDHIDEVISMEEKAKTALIKLSLTGNEGIKMLVRHAKDELEAVYKELVKPQGDTVDAQYLVKQARLHDRKDLWLWFLNFFNEARQAKKEVEEFILEQEKPVEDDEDY